MLDYRKGTIDWESGEKEFKKSLRLIKIITRVLEACIFVLSIAIVVLVWLILGGS